MSTIARLTLSDYDRMIAAGIFDGAARRRIEFIRGEIREMPPIGPLHAEVVTRLQEWSTQNIPEGEARVRVQCSIGLPDSESAPEPDLAWVAPKDYSQRRPLAEDVFLAIEVADTSLAYDRGEKADLYAAAGIAEYWLVDLLAGVIEVRRDPLAGHYRTLQTFTADQQAHPLRFPHIALRPSELL